MLGRQLTGSRWYGKHLLSWSTRLHVHYWWLLVSLLRALVAHHWRSRPGAGEAVSARAARHVARVLRVSVTRSWRVHGHLGVAWHSHKVSARRVLVSHHVSSHPWSHRLGELTWRPAECNMLYIRAHSVVRHLYLLGIAWHRLRLRAVGVGWHGPGRGLYRGSRVRELHWVCFIVRLAVVGLYRATTRRMVGSGTLHHLWTLQMRGKLVLVGNRAVRHVIVRRGQRRGRNGVFEQFHVALLRVGCWEIPSWGCAVRGWDATIVRHVRILGFLLHALNRAKWSFQLNSLQSWPLTTKEARHGWSFAGLRARGRCKHWA
jgi:hypothetical protein